MTLREFQDSLLRDAPPGGLSAPLAGLWWDAKDDWEKAHESVQKDEHPHSAWVHAYLHRKEKDLSNAAYWYGRAGKPVPVSSLELEWLEIAAGCTDS